MGVRVVRGDRGREHTSATGGEKGERKNDQNGNSEAKTTETKGVQATKEKETTEGNGRGGGRRND